MGYTITELTILLPLHILAALGWKGPANKVGMAARPVQ